jgi:ribosomal protein S27AE
MEYMGKNTTEDEKKSLKDKLTRKTKVCPTCKGTGKVAA